MFKEAFGVLRMRNEFFMFNRLYLMTYVSSGDGKGVIFSVLIDLSRGVTILARKNFLS